MDPLSIASSVISLFNTSVAVVNAGRQKKTFSATEQLEVLVHIGILDGLRQSALTATKEIHAEGVVSCLQLCQDRLDGLSNLIEKSGKAHFGKEARRVTGEFMRSVQLLRDVVMECATLQTLPYVEALL